MSAPALPHVPWAEFEDAAMLTQSLMPWPPCGISGTPATTFGRCWLVFPSRVFVALRDVVTVSGSPVRNEFTALIDHPPHGLDWPKGKR
jgi:hypothetical protein